MTCKIWAGFSLSVCCKGNSIETLRKLARWIHLFKLIIWAPFSRRKLRTRLGKIRCGTKVLIFLFSRWVIFWKLPFTMKTTSRTILSGQTNSRQDSFAGTKESQSGSNLTLRTRKPQKYWLKLYTCPLGRHGIKNTTRSLKVRQTTRYLLLTVFIIGQMHS